MVVRYALAQDEHAFPIPAVNDSDKKFQVQLNSTTVSSLTLPGGAYNWAIIRPTNYCWMKFDADPVIPSSQSFVEDLSILIAPGDTYFIDVLDKTTMRFVSNSGSAMNVNVLFYSN